jgi:acyl carrier protein
MLADSEQTDVIRLFSESLRELKGKTFDHIDHDTVIADLGIDSITFVELVGILEDELDVVLADEELTRIRTVGDLERTVSEKRQSKA